MKQIHKIKQWLALLLAVVLCVNSPVEAVYASEAENVVSGELTEEKTELAAEALSFEGTNAAGSLIAKEISEYQKVTEERSEEDCRITELSVSGSTASVSYTLRTGQSGTVVVALYEEGEEPGQMRAIGRSYAYGGNSDGTGTVEVSLSSVEGFSGLPDYFIAAAYLLDDSGIPLGRSYTTMQYTKEMVKLSNASAGDFPQEQVLNLDGDDTTNFAVYSDDTLMAEEGSGRNQITDNGDGSYTVRDADSSFASLQPGDCFSYTCADGSLLLVKAASVTTDGAVVTVREDTAADLTDFFDYVKLEGDSSGSEMQVDSSALPDGVSYEGGMAMAQTRSRETGTFSHSLSYQINNGVFSGSISAKFKEHIEYQMALGQQYLSVAVDFSLGSSGGISGSINKEIPLGSIFMSPIPLVKTGLALSVVMRAEAEIQISANFTSRVGFAYDSRNGEQSLCREPKMTYDIEPSGSLYMGVKLTPYVAALSEKLCSGSLSAEMGMEAVVGPNSAENHVCRVCVAGTLYKFLSASAGIQVVSGQKVSMNLITFRMKDKDFYYSNDFKEFGWGTCPHILYKLTVYLLDGVTGQPVTDAVPALLEDAGQASETALLPVQGQAGVYSARLGSGTLYTVRAQKEKLYGEASVFLVKDVSLTVSMKEDGILSVHAVDEKGNSVPGASVFTADQGTLGVTDAEGKAKFGLDPGTYELEASSGELSGKKKIEMTEESTEVTIVLAKKEEETETERQTEERIPEFTAPEGTEKVIVRARDYDGNPVPMDFFYAVPRFQWNDMYFKYNYLDVRGSYGLFSLPQGEYNFICRSDTMEGAVNAYVESGTNDIEIRVYETTIMELRVQVITRSGYPVQGAIVQPFNRFHGALVSSYPMAKEVTTGRDGTAVFQLFWGDSGYLDVYAGDHGGSRVDFHILEDGETIQVIVNDTYGILPGGIRWKVEDNVLTFSGSGEMPPLEEYGIIHNPSSDYSWIEPPWRGDIEKVILSEGITSVGASTFSNCNYLHDVVLPSTLTSIGGSAFENCDLKAVHIPESVTVIGDEAFRGCRSLTEVHIPESVTVIGDRAFWGCSSLTEVHIPESVTVIGDWAFVNCNELKDVVFTGNKPTFGSEVFGGRTVTAWYPSGDSSWSGIEREDIDRNITWKEYDPSAAAFAEDPLDALALDGAVEYDMVLSLDETEEPVTEQAQPETADSLPELAQPAETETDSVWFETGELLLEDIDLVVPEEIVLVPGEEEQPLAEMDPELPEETVPLPEGEEHLQSAPGQDEDDLIFIEEISDIVYAGVDAEAGRSQFFSCQDLLPDRECFFAVLKDEHGEIDAGNVLYAAQGRTDAEGRVSFRYPSSADGTPHIYAASRKNSLEYAEVRITGRTTGRVLYPTAVITLDGHTLDSSEYEVSVSGSMVAYGHYIVTVEGRGGYTGRLQFDCTVARGHTHSYGEPVFQWDGFTSCLALFYCSFANCADSPVEVNCTIEETEAGGVPLYTATVQWNGKTYTSEKTGMPESDSHVHNYGTPSFQWSGVTSCTALFICSNPGCPEPSVEVNCTIEVTEVGGVPLYTATVQWNGNTYTSNAEGTASDSHVHSWSRWTVMAAASITAPQMEQRVCAVCGAEETRESGSTLKPFVRLNAKTLRLQVRQSTSKLKVSMANGDAVKSWKSSNTKIVKVSKTGKLTARNKTGKAKVTVKLKSGKSTSVRVTVQKGKVATTKITGVPKKLSLKKGKTAILKPALAPITSQDKIAYTSSNKRVVRVSKSGKLTAQKKGSATITVRAGKKTVKCKVTVK